MPHRMFRSSGRRIGCRHSSFRRVAGRGRGRRTRRSRMSALHGKPRRKPRSCSDRCAHRHTDRHIPVAPRGSRISRWNSSGLRDRRFRRPRSASRWCGGRRTSFRTPIRQPGTRRRKLQQSRTHRAHTPLHSHHSSAHRSWYRCTCHRSPRTQIDRHNPASRHMSDPGCRRLHSCHNGRRPSPRRRNRGRRRCSPRDTGNLPRRNPESRHTCSRTHRSWPDREVDRRRSRSSRSGDTCTGRHHRGTPCPPRTDCCKTRSGRSC